MPRAASARRAEPGHRPPLPPVRLASRPKLDTLSTQRRPPLATSPSAAVRAGALLRLARTLRKTGGSGDPGDSDEALRVYANLALVPDARLSGLPADLVARRARCNLLDELGRDAELGREARALQMDLLAARWPIDQGTFLAYAEQIDRWVGAEPPVTAHRDALSDGSAWVWRQWAESGRGAAPRTSAGRAWQGVTHAR